MKTNYKIIFLFIALLFGYLCAFGQSVLAVEKVSITVSNLDKSIDFYTQVLNFKKESVEKISGKKAQKLFGLSAENPTVQIATLKIGDEIIELMEFSNTPPNRPIPLDSKSNDLWFQHIAIVVDNMEVAYEKVKKAKVVHVSTSPQILPEYISAAAGIKAFYFQDPDGHNLELIYFPKNKGNDKWHQEKKIMVNNNPSNFLGIDHTAIGIADTDESYLFWRDILKLEVGGHSENYGPEQEHLNQIFGARLFITGLHTNEGFGIEFLDYIAPPGGRAYPADSQPTDLWHWHTTLKVDGLDELAKQLLDSGFQFISNGIVQLENSQKALMVRDPDGHAVLLLE
ncbi:MAG: VOC family protein [Saprospiraceae bacterium]